MSEKREFFSNSLKDAIAKAAQELNISEDQLRYEIITEKTKYFGHSQREIYILAWPADGSEEKSLKEFIESLIKAMEAKIDYRISDGRGFIKVDFHGDDYRLMLYQNGSLLNAIQYLLNRLFSDTIGKKIYCECKNFRKHREDELSQLAHRYARDILKNGKPINIKGLNPFERRIIHMTINKYSQLESKSAGENYQKVITIRKV